MILFENDSAVAAFWFAAEEYIMRFLKPRASALLLWRTEATVMIGANQVSGAESDGAYTKAAAIKLVRRPSGGGAIFTDEGTLQYTVILPYRAEVDPKTFIRDWLAKPVIDTLAQFGAEASLKGRNDILIRGEKISGLAQHIQNGYLCSHGSLLFSVDMEKLTKALTVDPEKIRTKAVASVRARVTNISDHIAEKNILAFREALIGRFAQEYALTRRAFTADELRQIETIRGERYENPAWTFGRDPAFTFSNKKRFPGGMIEVLLDVKDGLIQNAAIRGDFLALRPVRELEKALEGLPHRKEAIAEALQRIDVTSFLGSLGREELTDILFNHKES